MVKREFFGDSKEIKITMDYDLYIMLMSAISYEASREEYTAYKEEFKILLEEIEASEYKSYWPTIETEGD